MKIILKQDIKGVGRKFEVKEISDGYANNFLLPKKLAEHASPETVKKYEALKKEALAQEERDNSLAHEHLKTLKDVTITLKKKTNDKGHLFEKVHVEELILAIKESTGISLSESAISFSKPIKEVGLHVANITLGRHSGTTQIEVVRE